jgi:hypothetical protein
VHVFVSYSRRDATFVTRLVAMLEGDGHDVWVDTDDIRGSEEWRASIVRGIRQADVVVLVISPHSMASEDVDREVTVAAQEGRRIVPVLLEPAPLSDSIGYELAGVQHVSFADRPFEEAVAELRSALVSDRPAASAPRRSASAPPVARPRADRTRSPRNNRRSALGAVALLVVAGGAAAVLSRVLDDDDPESVTFDAPSTGVAAGDGGSTASSTVLDADVWFAGYEITVHEASFEPGQRAVTVDVTMKNVQPSASNPLDILLDRVAVEWDGRRATGFCDACSPLPPAASGNDTWTFSIDDEGFELQDAALVLGQPTDHRAIVPFDGSPPTGDRPTTLPLSGVVDDGAGTSFTVERVEILPARCSGLSSSLAYDPGPADEVAVVVWGTALTTRTGSVGFGTALLVLPDGTALGSSSLTGVIYVLGTAQPERNIPVCFAVRVPTSGEHRFVAAAVDVEPASPGIAFTFEA